MKIKIKEIESVVTQSGNSGHVIVPKDWIGKEVIVKIKETNHKSSAVFPRHHSTMWYMKLKYVNVETSLNDLGLLSIHWSPL